MTSTETMNRDDERQDVQRLALLEGNMTTIRTSIMTCPEDGPAVALVVDPLDPIAVRLGLIDEATVRRTKDRLTEDATLQHPLFVLASDADGIRALLRGHPDSADLIAETAPSGRSWVVVVASGGVSVAAIEFPPGPPAGQA